MRISNRYARQRDAGGTRRLWRNHVLESLELWTGEQPWDNSTNLPEGSQSHDCTFERIYFDFHTGSFCRLENMRQTRIPWNQELKRETLANTALRIMHMLSLLEPQYERRSTWLASSDYHIRHCSKRTGSDGVAASSRRNMNPM